ncbi:MAG: HAD family phosphatase [Lachnospiraceae bacterium]|jgi:DNA helicase-2/ATP-dependent DNA helicase PcrA|nr:HAD family phosphatase [Lachnospiraceae bacterium]
MVRAVVFDMDGVIFDSEKLYRKHWRISAQENNLPLDIMEGLLDKIAGATKERNERLMKDHFGEDFDYMKFRTLTMNRMDEDIRINGVELKPGVFELLDYLKENGYKIALATSTQKERAEGNLTRAGVIDYFDGIMYGGIVPHGKPAPDIYEYACELIGVKPNEAIGVEDSINGLKSSHAAGLYTIMVVDLIKPNDVARENADMICDSLFEVRDYLETLHDKR